MQKKILKKYFNQSYWKDKTILITGVNGFIGGNLSKKLISLGSNVIGISNEDSKNKFLIYENIDKKIINYKLDLRSYNSIKYVTLKHKIDICFHLAAQVDVNKAKLDPFTTFESNIRGTYNLLEVLRNTDSIKSIVMASSDKAYGEYPKKDLPYLEDYSLKAIYPYDVSKAAADMIAKSYASNLFNLPVITTRFSNIYGPGQLNFSALIPDCILANLNYKKFIPRGDGENLRDFLFVNDVVELYLCLAYNLDNNQNLKGEIFNAGTGSGYKVKDIIFKICEINKNLDLYNEIQLSFKNKKLTGEIENQFMTYDKLNSYFNWMPQYSINEGLVATFNWYKDFLENNSYKNFRND